MAPTVSELSERRLHLPLEEHLQRALRITSHSGDPLKIRRLSHRSPFRITYSKRMGLVVEGGVREGDSPGLPSSNTLSPRLGGGSSTQLKQELIDITLRTMILLKRNQQLQRKLDALQSETRALGRAAAAGAGQLEE